MKEREVSEDVPDGFYKATRPDGTDFHTGTVLYEVGKTVRLPKGSPKQGTLCGAGFLHAADVPTETLVGGAWPCRLFEVTGTPRAGFGVGHPHKGGFRQLKVVRELPAWQVFGPQGERVVALIERCRSLTDEDLRRLAAALAAAWDAAWDAARDAAWDAAWAAARAAARDAAWAAARAAARDAVIALVVADLITPEHFDLLYGPWQRAIEGAQGE